VDIHNVGESRRAIRVTFDHQIFSGQTYGGVSRYFCELAARIACMPSFRVRVVAPLFSNHHLRVSCLPTLGVFMPALARTHRLRAALSQFVAPGVTALTRPQVVHETYYARRPVAPRGAGVVVTVHDMIHERMPDLFPRNDPTSALKRQAVGRADHVICISERTRADLIDIFGIETSRTSVIYHGHDSTALIPDAGTSIPDRPYVLYVGGRGGYKNFARFVDAFAISRWNKEMCVVAFGGPKFSAAEHEQFAALDVRHATGDDGSLAAFYAGATAFVYPSLYEGFGIPVLEAMALGCPVVSSNGGSIPEVGGDAAEYFDPKNIEDIAVALDRVLSSSAFRDQLKERGRRRIALFSWDRTAHQTAEVYAHVAGR
jgi:glycosyltransferase involved in cell wall biosynthesis